MRRLPQLVVLSLLSLSPGVVRAFPPMPLPDGDVLVALGTGVDSGLTDWDCTTLAFLTAATPAVGGYFDFESDEPPSIYLGWPLEFPFAGDAGSSRVQDGACAGDHIYKSHRLLLEPGLIARGEGRAEVEFHGRPGYRWMARAGERWGFGLGAGAVFDSTDGFAVGVSPEAVLQYGSCCAPSYLSLAFRWEYFPDDDAQGILATVNWSYW